MAHTSEKPYTQLDGTVEVECQSNCKRDTTTQPVVNYKSNEKYSSATGLEESVCSRNEIIYKVGMAHTSENLYTHLDRTIEVEGQGNCERDTTTQPVVYDKSIEKFSSATGLEENVCSRNGSLNIDSNEQITRNAENSTKKPQNLHGCPLCNKHFSRNGNLKKHILSHSRQPRQVKSFDCPVCSKSLSSLSYLKTHMYIHTGERPYVCPYCNKGFTQPSNLKMHVTVHTGEKPHACPDCGKRFRIFCNLQSHRQFHISDRPHSCSECGKTFRYDSALRKHIRDHKAKKLSLKCSYCDMTFKNPRDLKPHVRTHTAENLHMCPHCPKGFNSLANLITHVRVHTGEKPYVCPHCDKRFSQLGSMKSHIFIHTGEKPFMCHKCGKASRSLSTHNTHKCIKIHRKCPHCTRRFTNPLAYEAHLSLHREEQFHVCRYCGKAFVALVYLEKHIANICQGKGQTLSTEGAPAVTSHKKSSEACKKSFTVITKKIVHVRNTSKDSGSSRIETLEDQPSSHQERKLHICNNCSKGFSSTSSFQTHMSVHKEKPYVCPHCNKGFKLQSQVQKHVVVHQGSGILVCDDCGDTFNEISVLRNHLLEHTHKELILKCPVCSRVCEELKQTATHRHGMLYACSSCHRKSVQESFLRAHFLQTGGGDKTCRQCSMCVHGFLKTADLKTHLLAHI